MKEKKKQEKPSGKIHYINVFHDGNNFITTGDILFTKKEVEKEISQLNMLLFKKTVEVEL